MARRRFAGGGGTDDPDVTDQYDYATTSEPVDQGGALSNGSDATTLTPTEQMARIGAGTESLQRQLATSGILRGAGIQTSPLVDPSQAPGATNLPLLAAAGAMLSPTRSGGFSEALGNAFSAAVPVAEKQRALQESAQLRKAQMDNNAAIWGARTDVQRDRNDIYAQRVADQKAIADRVAELRGQGLDERTANHRALIELGQGKLGAYQDRTDVQRDLGNARVNLSQQSILLRQNALDALVKQRGIQNDIAQKNALARELSHMTDEQIRYISANKDPMGVTPPPTPQQAGTAVNRMRDQSRSAIGAAPTAPSTPTMSPADRDASLANARAAIAAGKDPNAVRQRLQAAGIDPSGL